MRLEAMIRAMQLWLHCYNDHLLEQSVSYILLQRTFRFDYSQTDDCSDVEIVILI